MKICKYAGLPLLVSILFLLNSSAIAQGQQDTAMYVHYINVGQGDAALLEFPTGAVLIDAGAQDVRHRDYLIKYLRDFFKRRKNLNNTLDLIMITHNHIDHNYVLDSIATIFKVKNYIDNGLKVGSGKKNQLWLQKNAALKGINYRSVSFEQVAASGSCDGLTDSIISPIKGGRFRPSIHLLSGRFENQPADWSKTIFKNGNNHSLVIKVTFGSSSFLFSGDLETEGLKKILKQYASCNTLDVDILKVGHHGADNGITKEYLKLVTPLSAIISCGAWNFGAGPPPKNFTTYAYGHPRIAALTALELAIPGFRTTPISIKAGTAGKKFQAFKVTKEIYATPWDDTVLLEATNKGKYTILRKPVN